MAVIAVTAVTLYPSATPSATASVYPWWYSAGKEQKQIITRKLKITGVTAADTATPTVLGFSSILEVAGGAFGETATTGFHVALDPRANSGAGGLIIGAGPSNETIYLTVTGTAAAVSATFGS